MAVLNNYIYQTPVQTVTLAGAAALVVDLNLGHVVYVNLQANATSLVLSNVRAGTRIMFIVKQDVAGGGRTVAWTNLLWPAGTAPVLTVAQNSIDIVSVLYDGTSYWADFALDMKAP